MAISIDWGTRVISVPRADMLLVQTNPSEIRELDLDVFRLALKNLEDSEDGMPFPNTHNHNTIVSLGGVTYARIIEIINGYTITFEDGQYAVNLVGANSNVGDVVNLNQVSVRSNNSAGLTYSKEIEDQSFHDARVWIDTFTGLPGTQFPRGTPSSPSDNYPDTVTIISNRNLPNRLHLKGTLVLPSGADLSLSNWLGTSSAIAILVVTNGQDFTNARITGITVTGNPSGEFTVQDGVIQNLVGFIGDATNTGFGGTIALPSGASTAIYTFHDCFSVVPGTSSPILDCNNASNLLIQFRGYSGGIEIQNYSSSDNNMTIDLNSGHVILDSTCTDGTIVVRGAGHITDNSGANCIVVRKGLALNETDGLLKEKRWIALH